MICDRKIGPYPCCSVVCGDCLELMRELSATVDAVITDPPYGCGKAEWDKNFPVAWYSLASSLSHMVVIITGSCGLKESISLVGDDFVDVIAARNMNGMTRGPIGFGNWLAAVVAKGKPRQGPNAFDFSVDNDSMPAHPCPKPIAYMLKLVDRVTDEEATILDPFCGSGTTLVAAKYLRRHFLGFELHWEYVDETLSRLAEIEVQAKLFEAEQMELIA